MPGIAQDFVIPKNLVLKVVSGSITSVSFFSSASGFREISMKVFIDTNAFYNNWFVGNAHFKLLFHYLNNEQLDLLLSNLVVQEVNNLRNKEVGESKVEINRLFNRLKKVNRADIGVSIDDVKISDYDIQQILSTKVHSIEGISYEDVSHADVVSRALNVVKPFTDGEKGYRDTLIWLSFLKYLQDNRITSPVAFITANKNDFFEKKGSELVFNRDLLNDISMLGINTEIKPYLNVFDFVKDNVDQISNAVDRQEILDDQEDFLIQETESYLNAMNNSALSELLMTRVFSDKLTEIIDIKSSIFEGLEDPEVDYVSELTSPSVYITCNYEMRHVDLVVTIELVEFKQHVDEIEAIKTLYNLAIDGDYVNLSFIIRSLGITAAFEYNATTEECSNLTVDRIWDQS
ncbi:PIN domain-containing protein [Rheinheimera soli]|uniref:PIN domain-containing protein n=1 Tax=Rheinheimera soli TaxID=443616 RepID=UPI001E552C96|nr:PIN domain-containing protein [Rheinheimera soli]